MNSKIPRAVNDSRTVEMQINSGEDCSINTKWNVKLKVCWTEKELYKNMWNVMFYIGEMLFEVQTLIFVQLCWHFGRYSFHDNCSIKNYHVYWSISVKSSKASFKMLLSVWLTIVENKLETSCDQVTFGMTLSRNYNSHGSRSNHPCPFSSEVLSTKIKMKTRNTIVS